MNLNNPYAMKIKFFAPVLLMSALWFASCDSSDDSDTTLAPADASELRATAQDGQWRITYFFDTDKEETSDFAGYVFTFGADGTVTATKDAIEVSGTWSVSDSSSSSSDDSPDDSSDVDFNLFFAGSALFEDLNDDWDILEYTSTRIELIDVSGGNGGTDYLTFEKN